MSLLLSSDDVRRVHAALALALVLLVPSAVRRVVKTEDGKPSPTCGALPVRIDGRWACEPEARRPDPVRSLWLGRKLDLSTVDAPALTVVPGIGVRLSARIVEDRRVNGLFRSIEEVERVRGIGPALRRRLESYAEAQGDRATTQEGR